LFIDGAMLNMVTLKFVFDVFYFWLNNIQKKGREKERAKWK